MTGLRRREAQRGSPILSEPSSGQYRFTYPWDPAIGLTDGNYDLSCSVSDGANASSTDYASHSDEVRLDSTSPTVLEVREAAGGVGSYAEDDDLIVEIEFSEVVVIAGGVNLQLKLMSAQVLGCRVLQPYCCAAYHRSPIHLRG